ncbi:MAG TPA: hypothetical protein VK846_09895 [Candidatus Limnocylindria bacterium]|nr:hypothetical protein [Candidatus Limnocylindria bacterium]
MKPLPLLVAVVTVLVGCATSPEQKIADQQRREAEREQRQQRERTEQQRRHKEEVERDRQKYAHLNTDEIRIASLSQEIAGGYFGYGWGLLVAKGIYDGKVKEREILAMELVRRGETLNLSPPIISQNFPRVRASQSLAIGSVYVGVGDGHWIERVLDSGKLIKLEDRSLWQISPLA